MNFKKYPVPQKWSDFIFGVLLLGLAFLVLKSFFNQVLFHPSRYLFGPGGDAIKNYYTFIYYVLFDKGSHFSGLNYPYGENVIFTDNQPLLAYLSNFWHHHLSPIGANAIGIINAAMMLSILTGTFFIYLILRKNLLPGWYAVPAAVLIAFLSPQHIRLEAHYALAYIFIIPLQWYLIIRIFENRRNIFWYLAYLLSSLCIGFLHPYYLLVGNAFLLLSYTLVFGLQELKNFRKNAWFLAALLALAIVPVIVFQLWLKLHDPVADRPSAPYGFLVYRSSFDSVFFPVTSPLKEFWMETFRTKEPIWEGFAYVGLTGLVCLALSLVLMLRYLFRRRPTLIFRPVLPQPLRTGIWSATLVLLFAMGIPFIYGLENLVELISPLKQFRSIGRFAWIFYYTFSIYAAFYFYKLYRYLSLRGARSFAFGLLAIILTVWVIDIKVYLTPKVREIRKHDNANNFFPNQEFYTTLLAGANKKPSDFQAIIPIPYYNLGSEYFSITGTGNSIYESFKASLNLHLPVCADMMSRTSVSQSASLIQFFSHDLIRKELAFKLPSPKPFLLLVTKEDLKPYEQRLLAKARKLTENEYFYLYELPVSALQQNSNQQELQLFESQKANFTKQGSAFTSKPVSGSLFLNSFSGSAEPGLFDVGAAVASKKPIPLYNQVISGVSAADTTEFEASVWVFSDHTTLAATLAYKQFNPAGELIEEKYIPLKEATDIYKNWARSSVTFKLQHPANRIEIYVDGDKLKIDNFLLRPAETNVYAYTPDGKKLLLNNFLLQ